MMGRSCFGSALLLCFLLLIFSNNGFGRKLVHIYVHDQEHAIAAASEQEKSREMMELDYENPGANNRNSGFLFPTVPLPPPSPPLPQPPESGY